MARLHHVGGILQEKLADGRAVALRDLAQVRDPAREHVGLEGAAFGEPPFALGGLDEGDAVEQARERVGALGVAQALAEAAKVGAPLHALPLVGEQAPGHGEQLQVGLGEDIGAGCERAHGERTGAGAGLERQREVGADRKALESGRIEQSGPRAVGLGGQRQRAAGLELGGRRAAHVDQVQLALFPVHTAQQYGTRRELGLEQVEDRVGCLGEAREAAFREASERTQGGAAHLLPIGSQRKSVRGCGGREASCAAGNLTRSMTLRDLMGPGAPEVEISGLAYSSQSVTPGALFFCVPGFSSDGHDFAPDAVQRGAAALVTERRLDLGVPEVVVDDVRAAMGPAAARFYGDPTAELDVVGITGTNGKTTTAFLVRHLLEAAGRQTGLLGTVKRVVGGVEEEVERTTPEAIDLQETFRRMLDGGDVAAAMEVSSHALELGRVAGIRFACRVFTNLTQDHLDFHETMDAYFAAKRRLFEEPGPAVVNVDDEYGRRLAAEVDAVTFGIEHDADYRARDIEFDVMGSRFLLESPDGELRIESPLPGLFNVQNVLAAVAAVRSLGVEEISLEGFDRVPGRFEAVDEGQDFGVLVDYAHTPDSLENVLRAAREVTRGRLHVIFGAGGDRDRGKRPLMGDAARRLADRVLVTSDNPRSERPRRSSTR